jgi:ribosome biogenesis GTPase / thiamine phosphate phosphatase
MENGLEMARVVAVDREHYVVVNGSDAIPAEMTGKLMFCVESPLDYPAVGDWVQVQYVNQGSHAMIHAVKKRKTVLKRKTAGKKISYQLIAANIDTAFIVQSLDANYNLRRLERYMVMVYDGGIQPMVLLSKSDLLSSQAIRQRIEAIQAVFPEIRVVAFSNKNGDGIQTVKDLLESGNIYCLLGSSGVGKTTLLNQLLGEARFQTRQVREKDKKGRHATSRRQLITLENNAMIVDTPGMRELGNIAVESGLRSAFHDIDQLSAACRYPDCSHTRERGCAVLSAVSDGSLSKERYLNYSKMKKESMFHEMSYLDKKKKDKQFGKLIKSVMKSKKRKW